MKVKLYMLVGLVVAAFLVAGSVQAASVAVSDEDLAVISGKNMEAIGSGGVANGLAPYDCTLGGCVSLEEGDGNSQTGVYTWQDAHSADASNHKGANDVSGDNSAVQQNVVSTSNAISWGAASSGSGIVGTVGTDLLQVGMGTATQHIGGF